MSTVEELADRLGLTLFEYQEEVLAAERATPADSLRACLYYKTGAGKSLTALLMVAQSGCDASVVVAPPSTHKAWSELGTALGVATMPMSHAKFRMRETKLSRDVAVIADEMHLFGGHGGQGWKKLDRLAAGLRAPLILASATPNYNDADRVYCIQHVLDPMSCRGGFLQFLYDHCITEVNPFGRMPLVKGFQRHADAASYLSSLPHVYYVEDDLVNTIVDVEVPEKILPEMDRFGLDVRRDRIVASLIEEKHTRVFHNLVCNDGHLEQGPLQWIQAIEKKHGFPLLVYANHSTVAEAIDKTLSFYHYKVALVTGKTPTKKKAERISAFNDGVLDVLIGTASLATGTDGMDKVCDTLIILDDTEDASLRRQLIGRIMPRGGDGNVSKKRVYRLVLTP